MQRLLTALVVVAAAGLLVAYVSSSSESPAAVALEGGEGEGKHLLVRMEDANENARAGLARLRRIQRILMKKIDKKTSVIIDTVTGKTRGKPGPKGPPGFTGPRGRPGRTGRQGKEGPQGPVGPAGPPGNRGPTGPLGPMGPTGPSGDVGPKGAMGPRGYRGHKGRRGPIGAEGKQGVQGPTGPRGNGGAPGLAGVPGKMGSMGPIGRQGPPGLRPTRGQDEEDGLRLVGCRDGCCRLEVQHNGQWGTVCDDWFSDTSAFIACRQLGYSGGRQRQAFGGGQGQIWLDDVKCNPTDTRVQDCPHNPWGNHNCAHSEDVAVCCSH